MSNSNVLVLLSFQKYSVSEKRILRIYLHRDTHIPVFVHTYSLEFSKIL